MVVTDATRVAYDESEKPDIRASGNHAISKIRRSHTHAHTHTHTPKKLF